MEYSSKFIPVEIKYDFINKLEGTHLSAEWIGCRLNVKPMEKYDGQLQVMCYPKRYDEDTPCFLFELDIKDLKCGPVASRTKTNVYGLFWRVGLKSCKLFFAFENKSDYDTYVGYLKDVLISLEKFVNQQQDSVDENPLSFLLNSLNQTKDILPVPENLKDVTALTEDARISDASDIYQEVELRHPERQNHRPTRRPMAIIGDLFTMKRTKSVSSDITSNKTPELPPRNRLSVEDDKASTEKALLKKKRSIWRLVTKGKRSREASSASGKRLSDKSSKQSSASSLTDLDLRSGNYIKFDTFDDAFDAKSIPEDLLKSTQTNLKSMPIEVKRSTVSLNVLWSHNLSRVHGSNGDISSINLIGANVNSEQIHSEIFIEQDTREMAFGITPPRNYLKFQKYRTCEVDENGYAVMRPIIRDANKDVLHTSYVSMEDIARNARNLENNYDIIRGPPRRKISIDSRSSSGCSSDGDIEGLIPDTQQEKEHFSEVNSEVETISTKYNENSLSATKWTDTDSGLSESESFADQIDCNDSECEIERTVNNNGIELTTRTRPNSPSKDNSDFSPEKSCPTTTPLKVTPFIAMNEIDVGAQVVNTGPLAELCENKIVDNVDVIESVQSHSIGSNNENGMATEQPQEELIGTPQNKLFKGRNMTRSSTPYKSRRNSKQRKRRLASTRSNESPFTPNTQAKSNSQETSEEHGIEGHIIEGQGTVESIQSDCSNDSIDENQTIQSNECALGTPQNTSPGDRKVVRASTPYRFHNSKQRKRRLATTRSNGLSFTLENEPQIELSTERSEKNMFDDLDVLKSSQCNLCNQSINASDKNGVPTTRIPNNSKAESNSFPKRIWRTCIEIRKMTLSLVSLRRSMLNFA